MQRGLRERETRYSQFTIHRPCDLIFIPHLLAHAILTLDPGSPNILYGLDPATTTSQQIKTQFLDEYTFGARRGKWCDIFRTKGLSALRK